MKLCNDCKEIKPLTEFYSNGYTPAGTKKYKPKCKACEVVYRYITFTQKIIRILKESGRQYKCEECGYNKSTAALTFHHTDPGKKEFSLAQVPKTASEDFIRNEISKCRVLCSNCHMEEHYPHLTNIMLDDD